MTEIFCCLKSGNTGTNNQCFLSFESSFSRKNLLNSIHILSINTRNGSRNNGFRTCRNKHSVRIHCCNAFCGCFHTKFYFYPQFFKFYFVIICNPAHSFFEWRFLSKIYRSSEFVLTIDQRYFYTTFCKCLCCDHATWSAADNNCFVSFQIVFCISIPVFTTGTRIDCTFSRDAGTHPCIQALKTAKTIDTFAKFIFSSFQYFTSPFFICKPASSHRNKINNTALQKLLCNLWLTNTGNTDHRNRNMIFYRFDQIFSPTLWKRDRLHAYISCFV